MILTLWTNLTWKKKKCLEKVPASHRAGRPFCRWVCLCLCGWKGSWHRGRQLRSQNSLCFWSSHLGPPSTIALLCLSPPSPWQHHMIAAKEQESSCCVCVCVNCLVHVSAEKRRKHTEDGGKGWRASVIRGDGEKPTLRELLAVSDGGKKAENKSSNFQNCAFLIVSFKRCLRVRASLKLGIITRPLLYNHWFGFPSVFNQILTIRT